MNTASEKKVERILIINYEFPPLGGGGGVATYDLAIEWAKTARVDVLTSSFRGVPKYENMDGIHVYRAKIFFRKSRDAATFMSMFSYLVTGFIKGVGLCRKNRYDIINTHFVVPSGPLGHLLSKIFSIPNLLSLHGGDIYDPSKKMSPHNSWFFSRAVRWLLKKADAVVAQSSNTRQNAVTYYNPGREIDIIPLAFHPPEIPVVDRAELGLKKDDFVLVTIGRIIKRKAIDVLLKAIAKLPPTPYRLLIMGDGPEREYLEGLAHELGIEERVRFLGFIDDGDKYRYLSQSDLFVLTSLHEGFGIVFMESMYCGLPIVCTNNGGQVDFLTNEENALLINVGDVEACARSIKRFHDDGALYEYCAKNNRKRVQDFYAESVAEKYMEKYTKIIQNRGR